MFVTYTYPQRPPGQSTNVETFRLTGQSVGYTVKAADFKD